MKIDRFTWVGLGVAAIGWAVLIADLTVAESILTAGNIVAVVSLRTDIVTVAQATIVSGFGLAVIGTLRTGLGTLHGFFDAVLQRSFDVAPASPSGPIEPYMAPQPAPTTVDRMPATGSIRERNYVVLADGSVEVETLLGTRVFASLDEARDFIR